MSIQAIRVGEKIFEVGGHRVTASELVICDRPPCPDVCEVEPVEGQRCGLGRTFDCERWACVCDAGHATVSALSNKFNRDVVELDWDEAILQEMLGRIARLRAAAEEAQIVVERASAAQVKQLLQLIGL